MMLALVEATRLVGVDNCASLQCLYPSFTVFTPGLRLALRNLFGVKLEVSLDALAGFLVSDVP